MNIVSCMNIENNSFIIAVFYLSLPTITSFRYCMDHGGYQAFESRQEPSYNGTYFQTFNIPGIYFFQTQSINVERAFCVVQVVEKSR